MALSVASTPRSMTTQAAVTLLLPAYLSVRAKSPIGSLSDSQQTPLNRAESPCVDLDMSTDMNANPSRAISRRTALVGGISGAGILTLAACGSSGGGSGDA